MSLIVPRVRQACWISVIGSRCAGCPDGLPHTPVPQFDCPTLHSCPAVQPGPFVISSNGPPNNARRRDRRTQQFGRTVPLSQHKSYAGSPSRQSGAHESLVWRFLYIRWESNQVALLNRYETFGHSLVRAESGKDSRPHCFSRPSREWCLTPLRPAAMGHECYGVTRLIVSA